MTHLGREVRSQMDFILGTERRLFRKVSVRDPRKNSERYRILGCLLSATLRKHTKYLEQCMPLPLRTLTTLAREGGFLAVIRRLILKPKAR